MHDFSGSIAKLLILCLIAPITCGQIALALETRDRRDSPNQQQTDKTWSSPPVSITQQATQTPALDRLSTEPLMRIALATNVRSATVSTTAHLVNASELSAVPLEASRVHVEARALSPRPPANDATYDIQLSRALAREEADTLAALIREKIGEEVHVISDGAPDKWRVMVSEQSREAAEETRAKLEDAGFEILNVAAKATPPTGPGVAPSLKPGPPAPAKTAGSGSIRLTARASAPTREVVGFARGAAPLLRSNAPVVFASDDEANAPMRFNDKPYRGRLEVFANQRGALTVVNVIGLEDYVKGVVPNELSPGGYPAIEALKAQAIAARTYAMRNRGQFASEGYDLLPTTRSQVYRGLTSEHSLSSRAVDETRGLVATYNGEPINALYTSTCGGRTEDAENVFLQAVPYLRSRECAAEGKAALAPFVVKSSRDLLEIKEEKDLVFARDAALLAVNGVPLPVDKVSSSWLSARVSQTEARDWLFAASRLAHAQQFTMPEDATKAPEFSSALVAAVFGDQRADTLLDNADVEYLLAFRDAEQIPAANRADVAMLLRDGHLGLFADATLRPKETMARARVLHAIAHVLEARGLLALQKGTTRPAAGGTMILRSTKGKDQPVVVGHEAFLFREFGENLYQVKSVTLVGGEPVTFHVSAQGAVDYLEVRPAPNGASAERYSPFTNWTTGLTLGEVQARLSRSVRGIGSITDLRSAARGSSRRVIDLEVIGTAGTAHVRGGRIRSALGLREQLFVIDRLYDANGRVNGFVFIGRGWGHGVGLCQVGAYGLARQGFTSEQILKAYYTGIELTKLYN
jgi:stage II sporulation protein D